VKAEDVLERVRELGPYLRSQAIEAETLGRVPEGTAKHLKETGVVRLLQPTRWGGYAADPTIFLEAIISIAESCGASGWVSGIVGVHPWELAMMEEQAQRDVWSDDIDTWVCSSYMPTGKATPVAGGYELSGRWSFSSGCDLAEWAFLGGVRVDPDASGSGPPEVLHLLVPRSDVTIDDASWDVVGLRGTGSKDVTVSGAFVPEHRVVRAADIMNGNAPGLQGPVDPVFRMPWSCVFPGAISAAVIGIAQGALREALDYQSKRVTHRQGATTDSPIVMTEIGMASSEIDASQVQFLHNARRMYATVLAGGTVSMQTRSDGRRDQVRASWRAVRAVDALFDTAGGGALRTTSALQRYWRDAHAGLHHVINATDKSFHSWATVAMGLEPVDWLV
jgi:alkylation response protein AidB-like acyl-CoA dehydrogenase